MQVHTVNVKEFRVFRATSLDNDKKRLTKDCSGLQFQIDKLRKEVTSVQPIQCKVKYSYLFMPLYM